jgi:hypothetical protein
MQEEHPIHNERQRCFCYSAYHDPILEPIWSAQRIEFYKQLTGNNESQEALRQFANKYYANRFKSYGKNAISNGEVLYQKLESLGTNYIKLIVDPGLMTHIDDFVKFTKNTNNYTQKDPWIIRDLYAKKMGLTKVFRALKISEEDEINITEVGMFWSKCNTNDFQGKNLIDDINKKMHSKLNSSMKNEFMSVTKYPEIANFVAKTFKNDGRVVLFELQVPKLDLISPRPKRHWDNEGDISLVCADKFFHPWVEQFIPFVIEPSEIIGVKKGWLIDGTDSISNPFTDLKARIKIWGLETFQHLQNKNPLVSNTIDIEDEKRAITRKENNWQNDFI